MFRRTGVAKSKKQFLTVASKQKLSPKNIGLTSEEVLALNFWDLVLDVFRFLHATKVALQQNTSKTKPLLVHDRRPTDDIAHVSPTVQNPQDDHQRKKFNHETCFNNALCELGLVI